MLSENNKDMIYEILAQSFGLGVAMGFMVSCKDQKILSVIVEMLDYRRKLDEKQKMIEDQQIY